jgi:hypothetical protein
MATIITRQEGATAKGSPLTNKEMDDNLINLNTSKFESGDAIDNCVIGGTTPAAGTFTTFTSTGGITQENSGAQVLTINSTDNSGAAIKLSNTGSSNMGILVDSGVFSITDNLFTTSHLSISDSTSAATFAGALTCGTFTSAGIDDNATTETFQLGNAQADWGQSGNTFTHLRNVTDSWMAFSGSTAVNTGANVLCYGDAHSTSPNVLRLRQGSTDAIRIDTNIEISKNLELDGADIFQALATDAFIVSGGTTNILGGAILLYGQNHDSQAGDVALRSSNNEFFRWDESAGTLTLSTGIGSKTTAITIESTQVVSLKNDTALVWGTGTSRPAIIGDTVADTLDFYTSGSSALTLDSSQNATFSGVLDVSAAIPEVKLTDVGGNCYHNITGTANGSLTIAADVGDSGLNGSSLIFKVDNGEVMSIDSAGLTTFAANVTATQLILDSTNPYIKLADSDAPDNNYYVRDQSGVFKVQRFNGSDVLQSTPLQIDSTDVATFASNILFSGANWQLKSSTSDAADTSSGALGGGGGIGTSRGGYVQCFGNENATAAGDVRIYGGAVAGGGDIDIQAGSVAGQITLATGGNTALTIDSSQNVGIGVTPEAWQTGRAAIQLGPTASLHCSGTTSTASTVLGNNYYRSATGATYQVTNHSAIYYQLNGEHVWETAPSGTAGTAITWTEAMKIDNSGNVGIGTSSPAAKQHIAGAASSTTELLRLQSNTNSSEGDKVRLAFSSQVALDGTQRTNAAIDTLTTGVTGSHHGQLAFSTMTLGTLAERMRIDSSGNVGIGTSSPAERLHIKTAAVASYAKFTNDFTTQGLEIGVSNSGQGIINFQDNDDLRIFTNDTERMRIDSSGNLCIGVTSAYSGYKLSTYGWGKFRHPSGDGLVAIVGGSTTAVSVLAFGDTASDQIGSVSYYHSDDSMRFYTNSTARMRIDSSGNVGIGTSSPVVNAKTEISSSATGNVLALQLSNSSGSGSDSVSLRFRNSTLSTSSSGGAEITALRDPVDKGGSLIIETSSIAGSMTERMRINSAGHVTMPSQPAFLAKRNSTVSWFNGVIPFATDVLDVSNNHNNGVFTAPVDGTYFFTVNLVIAGGTDGYDDTIFWGFYKNGAGYQILYDNWSYLLGTAGNGVDMIVTQSATIYLSANDTVDIRITSVDFTTGLMRSASSWSGHLLG